MIASYGMYDWPEVRPTVDKFWALMRQDLSDAGVETPPRLERSIESYAQWTRQDLIFAQTCGLPYVTRLSGQVQLVATPCYAVEGCEGSNYSSVLLRNRKDTRDQLGDFENAQAAVNSLDSQSGHNALLGTLMDNGHSPSFFDQLAITGGHRESMRSVADKTADICCVDAVCWKLMQDVEPETATQLQPLFWTKPMSALPFITSNSTGPDILNALRNALKRAISKLPAGLPGIYLSDIAILSDADYDPIRALNERIIHSKIFN